MAFTQSMEFHEGEKMMHKRLHLEHEYNPTVPMLSPQAANMLMRAPLLALGTLDAEGRPWTSLWGGEKGFSRPLGNSVIGIRTPVAATLDPVVEILVGRNADGEVVQEQGEGRLLSGLSIDLETRKRVKLAGRMIAGALEGSDADDDDLLPEDVRGTRQGLLQLAVKIEQSMGNCPKYLNKKEIRPAFTNPRLLSDSVPLKEEAINLIQKSDLFFMSTSHPEHDMDANYRGGPPGFVRVVPSESGATQFVYPEYSGNRFYQSLGNLIANPHAGFCFPDFETGDCLYLTGTTEILFGKEAAEVMPRSNLAVRVTITAARHVSSILPFRGQLGELSPYNPVVRPLANENSALETIKAAVVNQAKLLEQTPITPTISRFRFSLENAESYTAGQYVTLDCSEHLDIGYSHMRDDDPRSLNDDFVRTFTVSSPPGLPARPAQCLADDEFEITIRKVGVVTDFLFKHGLRDNKRSLDLEIGVKGFGGNFMVSQDTPGQKVCFIAAGVGITPLMPCLPTLHLQDLHLLWTIRAADIGIAAHLLTQYPDLAQSLTLFVTGSTADDEQVEALSKVQDTQTRIESRRMKESDVIQYREEVQKWYLCTGTQQRRVVLEWLKGEEVLYEDYNF